MKPWTTTEIAVLVEQYATTSNKSLAQRLGRSVYAIESKAHDLRLTKAERMRYPFKTMEVGDAIDVATPCVNRVRLAAYGFGKRHGRRYAVWAAKNATRVRRVA